MTKHELKRLINEELKGVIKMNYAIFEAVDRAVENYFVDCDEGGKNE